MVENHKKHDLQRAPKVLVRSAASKNLSQAPTWQAASSSPAEAILQLQRSVGNRAVAGLLQPKLAVGAAHDSFEQEADRVADQVVSSQPRPAVQAGPLSATIHRLAQRAASPERPAPAGEAAFTAGVDVEARLAGSARTSGSPLPASVRSFMEPRFGADFSGVRLHTGAESAQLNRSVGARAFTYGQDIYLGAGAAGLESSEGRRLLAHELTHTLQQGAASPAGSTQAHRLQRKVLIGSEPGKSKEYKENDLVKAFDTANEQVGHAVWSGLRPDQKKARIKDFVKDRKNTYKLEYVAETRPDPKTGKDEKNWWKVTIPGKTDYFLDSSGGWRVLMDTFVGAEVVEKAAPSDAIGTTVNYKDTAYTERTPLVTQLVDDFSLNEDTVKTSLGRMIIGGQLNKDLKRSGPALKTDPDLVALKAARHESFGIGENGCTFFFLKAEDSVTIVAVGSHIRDAKHYQIIYGGTGYPAKGKFEF